MKKSNSLISSPSLFEISEELKSIITKIITADGECDDITYAELQKWQASLEIKAESIAHVKLRLEADSGYFKELEEAARARRKTCEWTIRRLTEYLMRAMVETNTKQIKKNDGLFTISLVDGRISTRIEDPNKLPLDLIEEVMIIRPKTDCIEFRLKTGEQIPGAHLEKGEPYITIRSGKNKENEKID